MPEIGFDFDQESRQANALIKRCIENLNTNSAVEKALHSPGAIVAIAKLRSVVTQSAGKEMDLLCVNLFRLGATVALSIHDVESIK
jgi:hypothetical protein